MSEVERVADGLYAAPPDGFVAARDAAVAEAKAAGRAKDATEIGRLRKPTVGAWLVNRLALTRPDLLEQLADLADQLRRAQRELAGDRVRALSARRKDLLTDLVAEAGSSAGQAQPEVPASRLPLAEVEDSLAAALADPAIAEQVRAGRLLRAVSYTGFGMVLPDQAADDAEATDRPRDNVIDINRRDRRAGRGGAAEAPSSAKAAPGPKPVVRKATSDRVADRRRSEAERGAREAAQQALAAAQAELAEAAERLSAADRAQQAASAELAEIEQALLTLAARREQARAESVRAKAAHSAARRALVAAERRLTKAESA